MKKLFIALTLASAFCSQAQITTDTSPPARAFADLSFSQVDMMLGGLSAVGISFEKTVTASQIQLFNFNKMGTNLVVTIKNKPTPGMFSVTEQQLAIPIVSCHALFAAFSASGVTNNSSTQITITNLQAGMGALRLQRVTNNVGVVTSQPYFRVTMFLK